MQTNKAWRSIIKLQRLVVSPSLPPNVTQTLLTSTCIKNIFNETGPQHMLYNCVSAKHQLTGQHTDSSCLVTGSMHSMQRGSHTSKTAGLLLAAQKTHKAGDWTQQGCRVRKPHVLSHLTFSGTMHLQ